MSFCSWLRESAVSPCYFLMENIALTYTYASNVGVIVATAPFCTAILGFIFLRDEKLKMGFLWDL